MDCHFPHFPHSTTIHSVDGVDMNAGSFSPFPPKRRLALFAGTLLLFVGGIAVAVSSLPPSDPPLLSWHLPTNMKSMAHWASVLRRYSSTHRIHVMVLYGLLFVFKQTFSIPGTAAMNLIGGMLYGVWAVPWIALLAATGASSAYFVSYYLLGDFILQSSGWARNKLKVLREQVQSHQGNQFWFLLFLRAFPLSPNWFLNFASPFLGIPLRTFFLTAWLGLMPYTYICVDAASTFTDILERAAGDPSALQDTPALINTSTMIKLGCLSLLALVPTLYTRRLKSKTWRVEDDVTGKVKGRLVAPPAWKMKIPFLPNTPTVLPLHKASQS